MKKNCGSRWKVNACVACKNPFRNLKILFNLDFSKIKYKWLQEFWLPILIIIGKEFFKHHILSIDGVSTGCIAKWIEILSERLIIFKHLQLHKMFMKHSIWKNDSIVEKLEELLIIVLTPLWFCLAWLSTQQSRIFYYSLLSWSALRSINEPGSKILF